MFATAAAIAMTIAFPPAWIGGGVNIPTPTSPPAPDPVRQSPVSRPVNPAAHPDPETVVSRPAAGAAVSGVPIAGVSYSVMLPMGGQSVPLPAGHWTAIAVATGDASTSAGPPTTSVFLALLQGGRIGGAALIAATTAPDPHEAGFPAPLDVQVPAFYYRRVFSSVDHGALDLWVCGSTMPAKWTDPLRQAALAAIRHQDLMLADRLESAVFRLADKRNWVSADFMYPDPAPTSDPVKPWTEAAVLSDTDTLSHVEKVRRWGKQWHEIMRRSFAGTLRPGDEAQIDPP